MQDFLRPQNNSIMLLKIQSALTSKVQDCVETAPDAEDDMDFFSIEVVPTRQIVRHVKMRYGHVGIGFICFESLQLHGPQL